MARNKFLKRIRSAARALRRLLMCGSTKVKEQSIPAEINETEDFLAEPVLSLIPKWKTTRFVNLKGAPQFQTGSSSGHIEEPMLDKIFIGPDLPFMQRSKAAYGDVEQRIFIETSLVLDFFSGPLPEVTERIFFGMETILLAARVEESLIKFTRCPYKDGLKFEAEAPQHKVSCFMGGADVQISIARLLKKVDPLRGEKTTFDCVLFDVNKDGLVLLMEKEQTFY